MYKLGGLAAENLFLCVSKMYVGVVFRKPSVRLAMEEASYEAGNLPATMSDIVTATLPFLPLLLSPWFQPTIPYENTATKWFVPCPLTFERMEYFVNTFKRPVWLTMTTVLFLTAILWWGLANWRHSSLKGSRIFQILSCCFYNARAVVMGLSVTNTPNFWKLRFLFLVYVYYCFATSTVFQALFI